MSDFFNLPPPWNPGYTMPQNVDDEGLERHAFVTGMTERGTFDNPSVGTAGYAVPRYVTATGIGQNAMTTRWAPRGTAPRVKHWLDRPSSIITRQKRLPGGGTKVTFKSMGDAAPAGPPLPPDPSKPIPTSSGGIDSKTILLLGAAAVGAYLLFGKKK